MTRLGDLKDALQAREVSSEPGVCDVVGSRLPVSRRPTMPEVVDHLGTILRHTGTFPPFAPVGAMALVFEELLRNEVIDSGGNVSTVVTAQIVPQAVAHMRRYPGCCPACEIFLWPFLDALRLVPGNQLRGGGGSTPPAAVRQAAAGRVMTQEASGSRGYHFDAPPAGLLLQTERGRFARAMWSSQQGTAFRIVGVGEGTDLLCERRAQPGGGTWVGGRARCQATAPFAPHASIARVFADQQLLVDFVICDPEGTEQLCWQLMTLHATRRAVRAEAVARRVLDVEVMGH